MDFNSDTIGVATGWVARAIDLVDDETGRTIRLEPGLPVQDKDRLLRASKRHTEVGHRILAYYLWDMEERRESQLLGFPTTVDYAVKRLDLPRRSARELIEVGEALISLRLIVWLKAKKKLGAERGAPVSDADALQQFAQLFLASSPEGSVPGRSPSGESPIHVSVQWCAHCEQGTLATEDGPVSAAAIKAHRH